MHLIRLGDVYFRRGRSLTAGKREAVQLNNSLRLGMRKYKVVLDYNY